MLKPFQRRCGLLLKQGAGSRTYYVLNSAEHAPRAETVQAELPLEIPTSSGEDVVISANPHKLDPQSPQALVGIPAELLQRIQAAGLKPRQATVRELLRELCALRPYTAQELAQILGRKDSRELTRMHLKPMREAGILTLLYPESEKHPHQAYRTVREDKEQDGNAESASKTR